MTHLTCGACGVTKPADDYPAKAASPTGRRGECRDCYNRKRRQRRQENGATNPQLGEASNQLIVSALAELVAVRSEPWRHRAACRGLDADLFFPQRGGSPAYRRLVDDVCGNCPVRVECLHYAIDEGETIGWWGGISAKQRLRIIRERNAVA